MLNRYWGFEETPFQSQIDERWYYENPVHDEALARLFYLVEQLQPCGLLTGPAGTGKSLLQQILAGQAIRTQRKVAVVDLFGLSEAELLWSLASSLQLSPRNTDSTLQLWRRIQEHLRGLNYSQIQTVFIFDHLEQAEPCCVRVLERLLHLTNGCTGRETWPGCWITLVAATAHPELISSTYLLQHLSELRVELEAWDLETMTSYIDITLERAGVTEEIFTVDALPILFASSQGIPRQVNRLCHLCLLAGMGEDAHQISAEIVANVAGELAPKSIVPPEPKPSPVLAY